MSVGKRIDIKRDFNTIGVQNNNPPNIFEEEPVQVELNNFSLEQGGEVRITSKNPAYSNGGNSNSNVIVGGSNALLLQESNIQP
jgi:hypothetical protein